MIKAFGVLLFLIGSARADYSYRDKIKLKSCQNPSSLEPEMTISAPSNVLSLGNFTRYRNIGDQVEIIVSQSELQMISKNECKLYY